MDTPAGEEDHLAHDYLLMLRFVLINLVAFALSGAAYLQGWLTALFGQHMIILSGVIIAVFLYGLALAGLKVWQTSRALNDVKSGQPPAGGRAANYLESIASGDGEGRSIRIGMLRLKLSHRIAIVRHVANSLVFLGLIGTVIGFIIALSGVDPQAAAEVDTVGPMVSTLITGMSIALYTTLLGAILNVWLIVNHRLLATGTVDLLTEIVALGERGARA